MIKLSNDEVWIHLLQAELVEGEQPAAAELESPWYVKVLLAFSGWLAALFLLGFLALGFYSILDSVGMSLVIGGAMMCAAYFILRIPQSEFVEHLGLAVSLAGQALVISAIFNFFKPDSEIGWALIGLVQMGLVFVMPNFVHRVFSAFFSACAFSIFLNKVGLPYLFNGLVLFVCAWAWLNEFTFPRHIKKMRALGYGLTLAIIQLKGSALFSIGAMGWRKDYIDELWLKPWMGELLCVAATLYVVWALLKQNQLIRSRRAMLVALATVLFFCLLTVEAQGIAIGLTIILLGFSCANRVLLGLGAASLLFFVSSYYYLLNSSLLEKSLTLLTVGIALIFMRWLALRVVFDREDFQDA